MKQETSYYTDNELKELGLKSYGKNVLISRKASLYSMHKISLGNNVRIDDFSLLSGNIKVGDYVHINVSCGLFAGKSNIVFEDFVNLSSRISIYAISDDYTGETMTSPLVPSKYTNQTNAGVTLKKHVIVGCGTVILPGVTVAEGCSVGALSLLKENTEPWGMYAGTPARRLKERKRDLLILEQQFIGSLDAN